MLKVNKFQVKLDQHNIIIDVFKPIIEMFLVQTEAKNIKLQFN
jgi:hypothetical protein